MARRGFDPDEQYAGARRMTELERQVAELNGQVRELQILQRASLSRLFFLPGAIRNLLGITDDPVSISNAGVTTGGLAGELGSDGASMVYPLGEHLRLEVAPFAGYYTLSTVSGALQPKTFKFGPDGDATPDGVLMMLGYADLAKRTLELTNSPGYLAAAINGLTQPA